MRLRNLYPGVLLLMMLFNISCKKNDSINYDGLVYGPASNANYDAITSSFTLVNDVWIVGDNSAFPVKLTKSFNKDVKITAAIEPSLAKLYDSAKAAGMMYPPIPDGALGLVNNGVITVKAGQTQSMDSIRIVEKNTSLLVKGVTYLVPIVISTTDPELPIDHSKNITFLKLTTGASLNSITSMEGSSEFANSLRRTSFTAQPSGINTIYLRGLNQTAAPFDQRMEIAVNNSLIDEYNSKNGTEYIAAPENSYSITNNSVTITKGSTISTDSFSVLLPDLTLFDALKQYVIPVELKSVTGGGLTYPINSDKKVVYLVITTTVSNVDPANPVVSGAEIDRTPWVLNQSGQYSSYAIPRIKDNSYTTSWFTSFSASNPAWFTIDMGSVKTIKGFMWTSQFHFSGYVPLDITVQISDDGTNWTEIGKYFGNSTAGSSANPTRKYISFYEAVSSRYFRFTITRSSTSGYTGMSEIFAYE